MNFDQYLSEATESHWERMPPDSRGNSLKYRGEEFYLHQSAVSNTQFQWDYKKWKEKYKKMWIGKVAPTEHDYEFLTDKSQGPMFDMYTTRNNREIKVIETPDGLVVEDDMVSLRPLNEYPWLEDVVHIKGDLSIADKTITDLSMFKNLKKINGEIYLIRCDKLTSFHGLESLEQVASFNIDHCPEISNVSALNHKIKNGRNVFSIIPELRIGSPLWDEIQKIKDNNTWSIFA